MFLQRLRQPRHLRLQHFQPGAGNGATPIYRFYNNRTGAHFYTVSASERDFVISNYKDFKYESIAYYVWTTP